MAMVWNFQLIYDIFEGESAIIMDIMYENGPLKCDAFIFLASGTT
jgi:hypothetical protein